MSDAENLSFHRKYRPNNLASYIGNTALKETVVKALASNQRPQTILLYGDSGCGKTTMARIIAKEYNCMNRDVEKGACGTCDSCALMDDYIATGDTGRLYNVKEIDIGTNSGKNDIESVLEDVDMQGFGDEWRVYIFDEIQRASEALQTRLLKITEEPPEKVLFIFCTTNPEKLLDTLKNRCQIRGHVTKPDTKELSGLLAGICKVEGVEYDNAGLELICSRSEFTIRTSLQNLKQVIDEHQNALYSSVSKVFEEVSGEDLVKFFKCLIEHRVFEYVTLIHEVRTKMDLSVFVRELRNFVVKGIYLANALPVEGVTKGEFPTYKSLFEKLSIEEMGTLLQRLLSLDVYNLEMDLLLLGYIGIQKAETTQSNTDKADVVLPKIENELQQEQKNATQVVDTKNKAEYEAGVKASESYTEAVGLDDILASMGGTMVH